MNDETDNDDTHDNLGDEAGDESEKTDEDTFLSSALESLDAMANSPATSSASPVPSDDQIPLLDDIVLDDELTDTATPASATAGVDMHDLKAQFTAELLTDLDNLVAQITHDAVAESVDKAMLDAKLNLEENLLGEIKAALLQLVEELKDKEQN
ncbi:MAG: hypothetical protein BMS9Abin26_2167 [Gammaproteobacteria bacterium]|nr:MAG: hypothetical protein BMS9Abin26_2167 [Gammaproteobacteria bacterium]